MYWDHRWNDHNTFTKTGQVWRLLLVSQVLSLNVQVICDDKRKVLYYYGGWPGSVHDNRAWKNCRIFKSASTYFGEGEYLVGDCAYSKCNVMVQTFKKLPGISNLTQEQEFLILD